MVEKQRSRLARRVLSIAAAALLAAACVPAPPMKITALRTGLDIPWDLAFAPDNTLFYSERGRGLSAVVNNSPNLIFAPSDLYVGVEAGMMSIALSPGFALNRHLFVCFASTASGLPDVRIARVTVNAGYTAVSGRTDVLTGAPMNGLGELGRHSGCRIAFGPDGYLWVGTGDAAVGSAPQSPTSLGGKVLRIDGNGAPAPGNMGPPFDPRIQSYGHRNVQGLAFRADGTPFAVEHGPACDDELNLLVTGANYGWDPVPRTWTDPAYNENVPMTDLGRYPFAMPATWSSGCPTLAVSGASFVSGSRWKAWNDGIVMAALKGSRLRVILPSADGRTTRAISEALGGYGRLRSVKVGPYGALYVTTSNGRGLDQILVVAPTPS